MYANLFCTFFLRKDGLKLIFHPKRFFLRRDMKPFCNKMQVIAKRFSVDFSCGKLPVWVFLKVGVFGFYT